MKKIAVIGLGNISKKHRANLKNIFPNAKIYAMSSSGRPEPGEITHCDIFKTSLSSLINEGIDMAIVASPATFHAEHSIPLIKSGIPTLIEKPLSATKEDADKILKASKESLTPVSVGYCLRYLPSAQRVKNMIASEGLGEIYNVSIDVGQYLPDWRPVKDYHKTVSASKKLGGGVLLELSHDLDYAQWIFGSLISKYSSLRSSAELGLAVEDIADISAVTQSGAVVNIHLDFLQKHAYRTCNIIGSKGRIEWDLIKNSAYLLDKTGVKILYDGCGWDKNQMYMDMIRDFINKINSKSNKCIGVECSLDTVDLIEYIKSSSNTN